MSGCSPFPLLPDSGFFCQWRFCNGKSIMKKRTNRMKDVNYEEAVRQLEDIVEKMERGELDVDSMASRLKQAQGLIKLCKQKLKHTDDEIRKLLSDR